MNTQTHTYDRAALAAHRTRALTHGFMGTVVRGDLRDAARAAALDVAAQTGILPLREFRHSRYGRSVEPVQGTQARARRGATAYENTLAVFDLPHGIIYVPCYICGRLVDAWTADADHIYPRNSGGLSTRDNLMLTCSACNSEKRENRMVPPVVREHIASVVGGADDQIVMGADKKNGGPMWEWWSARPRRADGSDQPSTYWED